MTPSQKKLILFLGIIVATIAALQLYLYSELHEYSFGGLLGPLLISFTVGCLISGLSRRASRRFLGWLVGALMVAIVFSSPEALLTGTGEASWICFDRLHLFVSIGPYGFRSRHVAWLFVTSLSRCPMTIDTMPPNPAGSRQRRFYAEGSDWTSSARRA